ncbi:MAG: carbon monoxide dehydrogenase [Methanomicrobiales archaeon]|nr:carbon monoxide dehydrogenase [Methanomicrobiales archaeon]
MTATADLTWRDYIDHLAARLGFDRSGHRVRPGLYRLNNPSPESPVFASAGYTLSFDALRSSLAGRDAWLLVLDTMGINVWCAAGKGTFGTDELVRRIRLADLAGQVSHRTIILPQLGAPGVSARSVAQQSGFHVRWGPVRAADLPAFLDAGEASPAMRRVTFPLRDRIVLIPVELAHALPYALAASAVAIFFGHADIAGTVLLSVAAGTVLFPVLLPYLPAKDYTVNGLLLGFAVITPVVAAGGGGTGWPGLLWAGGNLLLWPAITAFLALNFTGCTPFTSRSGVKLEISRYMRIIAAMAAGGAAALALALLHAGGMA